LQRQQSWSAFPVNFITSNIYSISSWQDQKAAYIVSSSHIDKIGATDHIYVSRGLGQQQQLIHKLQQQCSITVKGRTIISSFISTLLSV